MWEAIPFHSAMGRRWRRRRRRRRKKRRRRGKKHTIVHGEIGLGLLHIVECKIILLFCSYFVVLNGRLFRLLTLIIYWCQCLPGSRTKLEISYSLFVGVYDLFYAYIYDMSNRWNHYPDLRIIRFSVLQVFLFFFAEKRQMRAKG